MSSSYNLRNRQISAANNTQSILNSDLVNHKDSHINKAEHPNGIMHRGKPKLNDDFTSNSIPRPHMQLTFPEKVRFLFH